jgi:hypothetical protein
VSEDTDELIRRIFCPECGADRLILLEARTGRVATAKCAKCHFTAALNDFEFMVVQ